MNQPTNPINPTDPQNLPALNFLLPQSAQRMHCTWRLHQEKDPNTQQVLLELPMMDVKWEFAMAFSVDGLPQQYSDPVVMTWLAPDALCVVTAMRVYARAVMANGSFLLELTGFEEAQAAWAQWVAGPGANTPFAARI